MLKVSEIKNNTIINSFVADPAEIKTATAAYVIVKNMTPADRVKMYDTAPEAFDTAIINEKTFRSFTSDKKIIAEKAQRVSHFYRLQAVQEIIKRIAAGADLDAVQTVILFDAFNDSVSDGSGKMEGIKSVSTAVFLNKQCAKNAATVGSICAHCYAMRYAGMRAALARKLELNTVLYTAAVIPEEYLPTVNAVFIRLESFGDLNNSIQVINYFNLCRKNSHAKIALWTKNPALIARAKTEKPQNLTIVYSGLYVNMADDLIAPVLNKYDFIDYAFVVYDRKYAAVNNVKINCAGVRCLSCLNCYRAGGVKIIRELLK